MTLPMSDLLHVSHRRRLTRFVAPRLETRSSLHHHVQMIVPGAVMTATTSHRIPYGTASEHNLRPVSANDQRKLDD